MNQSPEIDLDALHDAALTDDVDMARRLLANGADPNRQNSKGLTPLHLAAQQHSVETAKLLLASGARVDQTDQYGNTPLWTAVFNSRGRGAIIEILRSHGANVHSVNAAGRSPLDLARMIGNFDVRQYFQDLEK